MNHGIVSHCGVKDGRFFLTHGVSLPKRGGLAVFTGYKAALFEEAVHLGGNGIGTGGAYAITGKDFGIRLLFLKCLDGRIQAAAAEGAEGNHFLAGKVNVVQERLYGRGEGAEPDRIADENHVVGVEIGLDGLDFREDALGHLFLATLDGGAEVSVVGIHGDDFLHVGVQGLGDGIGHHLGGSVLGIVEHKGFLGLVLPARNGQQYGSEGHDSFHTRDNFR